MHSQALEQVAQILICIFIPASYVSQRVLQVAESSDRHQLRFELDEIPLMALGGVDAKSQDAKAVAESLLLPNAVNGVSEILPHSIAGASVRQPCSASHAPSKLKSAGA
jgi:hypothetical protein